MIIQDDENPNIMARHYAVKIEPRAYFLPEQSNEDANRFVFGYTIKITNESTMRVQLMARHWIITDADMKVEEVRGMGVIGHQPVLAPGEHFEYSSGSQLRTAVGTMKGAYQMIAEDGQRFDAPIPQFTLSIPRVLH